MFTTGQNYLIISSSTGIHVGQLVDMNDDWVKLTAVLHIGRLDKDLGKILSSGTGLSFVVKLPGLVFLQLNGARVYEWTQDLPEPSPVFDSHGKKKKAE